MTDVLVSLVDVNGRAQFAVAGVKMMFEPGYSSDTFPIVSPAVAPATSTSELPSV